MADVVALKVIVVMAFDRLPSGVLVVAYGPAWQQSEDQAVTLARGLAKMHDGVIAWSQAAESDGGMHPPVILFSEGDVPTKTIGPPPPQ